MPALITHPTDITLDMYRRVAFNGEKLRVAEGLLGAIADWRSEFLQVLAGRNSVPVYGVNVGAGDGSSVALSDSGIADYRLGLNSATSFGTPAPRRIARGIVLARLASFVDGSSAVSPELVRHLCGMLNNDSLPDVPLQGNGGSGEILPLGHLFSSVPRDVSLGPKESMSLVNGAPCAGALAADVALRAKAAHHVVELTTALACHALNVPEAHFDPILGRVWGGTWEQHVLARLTELLDGPFERDQHQARVSVRILPRVLAASHESTVALLGVAAVALSHPGDNPVFIRQGIDDGPARIISNGSFHNQRPIVAIDAVGRSFADLTQLGQHLIHAIYQSRTAMPNQDNLALGVAYMVAGAWSEDARLQAVPSLLSLTAVGQNDVPAPTFGAWRKYNAIEEALFAQMAILGALSSQALYSTGREATAKLAEHLATIRQEIPVIDKRRDVGSEIGRLKELFVVENLRRCREETI